MNSFFNLMLFPVQTNLTLCLLIPYRITISMLAIWPIGEQLHPSSTLIPHSQIQSKTRGAATADLSGGSIFKTLLQNRPTHQGWHTILSEDSQGATWPLHYLKAQTFSLLHRYDRKLSSITVLLSSLFLIATRNSWGFIQQPGNRETSCLNMCSCCLLFLSSIKLLISSNHSQADNIPATANRQETITSYRNVQLQTHFCGVNSQLST